MSVNGYSLSTLAELKAHLGITVLTDDTILETYVDSSSRLIERYLGRKIVARTYAQWYSGDACSKMRLAQYPVNIVYAILDGAATAFTLTSTVASDLRVSISINPEAMSSTVDGTIVPNAEITRTVANGTTTSTQLLFSTYKSVSALVTQINLTTGFSATLGTDMRTTQLRPIWGDAKYAAVLLTGANEPIGHSFDAATGIVSTYEFTGSRRSWTRLAEFHAGYGVIPPIIKQACNEIAAVMFFGRKRDGGIESESVGDYSYNLRGGDDSAIKAILADLLSTWREIR